MPLVYVLALYFLAIAASSPTVIFMYLRFWGCPVVLDIELSVSAWYEKARRVLLHARRILLLLLHAALRGGVRCAVQISKIHAKQSNDLVPITTRKNPDASDTHIKTQLLFMKTPYMDLRAGSTRMLICLTYPVSSPQRSAAPPRRDRGCQNTRLDVPLAYVYGSALSREQWRLELSMLEKLLR